MEIFIVRPFGVKKVRKKSGGEENFDFDRVQAELISPAFKALNLDAGTTGDIFAAGSIQEDMFNLLLLADIVIADITMHNANVFYELGIRHALRDRKTILLKCPGYDDTPFDITGYKYLSYDGQDPSKTIDALVRTINETIDTNRADSPVFNMLPRLESQNPERFLAMPEDFKEEVKLACETNQVGKLSLLASEAEGFNWRIPALRLIGEGLYDQSAYELARIAWEKIKSRYPDDMETNDRLASIYQRLAEKEMKQNPEEGNALLARSEIAIDTLLTNYDEMKKSERSEAYSLKGRNAKTRWLNVWADAPDDQKAQAAFQSGYLDVAYKHYEQGYYENLNHFYSGINALGLLTIIISLAGELPGEWELRYNTAEEAAQELKKLNEKKKCLVTSLQVSLEAERRRMDKIGEKNIWMEITSADFACLTEKNAPRVNAKYKRALEGSLPFHCEAARRQLEIYRRLKVMSANVDAGLSAIPLARKKPDENFHYLLFTGHMIDKPDRTIARFPQEKESSVRAGIKKKIEEELQKITGPVKGISGGACGGDILFHEICAELGVHTEMYLALPREQFIVESVQFAGPEWVERFDKLYSKLPHFVLSQEKELPNWLRKKENYTIWKRNNLWELNHALVNGGINMTLFALWDGKGGDGPGGTEHMVREAKSKGARLIHIEI